MEPPAKRPRPGAASGGGSVRALAGRAESGVLKFQGAAMLRSRVVFSVLSRRKIRIDGIREFDEDPGLRDYEASLLHLVEKLSTGCKVEISDTGTSVKFSPGFLVGGSVSHKCPVSRGVSYYLEALLLLGAFGKEPLRAVLRGVTHGGDDVSVDHWKSVVLPQVGLCGLEGVSLTWRRRGSAPGGGGEAVLSVPTVSALRPINVTIEGFVKRVRGVAVVTKLSPQVATRAATAARGVLQKLLPDVFVANDVYGGKEAGKGASLSVHLVAETTAGCLLAAERVAGAREAPEELGKAVAKGLLDAVARGGCVGVENVPLLLPLMALGPTDVSRLRVAALTPAAVETLRLLRSFFGVEFRLKAEPKGSVRTATLTGPAAVAVAKAKAEAREKQLEETRRETKKADKLTPGAAGAAIGEKRTIDEADVIPDDGVEVAQAPTILLSCVGIGYKNMAKKAT